MRKVEPPKMTGDLQSVVDQLNNFVKEIQVMRKESMSMLKELKSHRDDGSSLLVMEGIRNNVMGSINLYLKLKLDALKLLAVVADKLTPREAQKINGKLTSEDRESLSSVLEELKREKEQGYKK
jgi:hypothetical protein